MTIIHLRPEKQALLHDYERIIIVLNDEMANRATGQIKLNETRDNLRETNETVSKNKANRNKIFSLFKYGQNYG
jgi:hypothetical protein